MAERVNPVFGPNRLKLGIFGTNGAGIAMTNAPEYPELSWDRTLDSAMLADEGGFEVIVPFARWKGYVEEDPTHKTGNVFDCYTYAAGLSQATKTPGVFSTSHIPTIHPLLAAKQAATIDHISAGRFGLNVVAGWNKPELEMFGAPMKEHDARYDQAEEWLTLIRRLWSEEEAFDFEGSFYKIEKGVSMPKPVQSQMPPIMNAGGSEKGRHFAAKHADMAFVILQSDDPSDNAAQIADYKKFARDEYGRDIQVWSFGNVVQRETTDEAQKFHDHYVHDFGDEAAVEGWMRLQEMNTQVVPPEVLKMLRTRFKAGSGGIPLIGSPDLIAGKLSELSSAGLDGVLLSWINYSDGIKDFNSGVMPLLSQNGVRQ